jgi:hypothetical protein
MSLEPVLPQASGLETGEEIDLELLKAIPNGTIFAYNMNGVKRLAG